MRTIAAVTVGRSDYGIFLPVLRKIQAERDLRLSLIVAGMHLSPEFGLTCNDIEGDGFEISERVEMLLSSDTPEAIAKSMGLGTMGFAQAYARLRPDIVLVVGDRFEMHSAALAALPFTIPVAHIHGGEITQGAMDDALRHSITKLSHLHFVATEEYRSRVVQMGEEPWRVIVSGAPGLDNLANIDFLDRDELEVELGMSLKQGCLLVTYHPVTLEYLQTEWQVGELLEALKDCGFPLVFTKPNADTGGRIITRMLEDFVETNPHTRLVDNLGTRKYLSLMAQASAMVGNSSSGIIEAPSLGLPVVNIGTRQQGRVRGSNVIDVGYPRDEILAGVHQALQEDFRERAGMEANPYQHGPAADTIVSHLKSINLDDRLIQKRFYDTTGTFARQPVS